MTRRATMSRRALAPAAVLALAWPLLLAGGPGRWCPTQPTLTPTPAPAVATRAPAPAFTPPPPAPAVPAPPPPSPVTRRPAPLATHRPARPQRPFTGRGDLLLKAPGGQRKGLPLTLLVVVVLAPCVAAAVTRYAKNRLALVSRPRR